MKTDVEQLQNICMPLDGNIPPFDTDDVLEDCGDRLYAILVRGDIRIDAFLPKDDISELCCAIRRRDNNKQNIAFTQADVFSALFPTHTALETRLFYLGNIRPGEVMLRFYFEHGTMTWELAAGAAADLMAAIDALYGLCVLHCPKELMAGR